MISERSIRRVVQRFCLSPDSDTSPDAQGLQIILDASASMTAGDGSKEQRAHELAIMLLKLSAQAARPGELWALRGADRNRTFTVAEADRVAHLPLDGTSHLAESWPHDLLPRGNHRVLISDFLFPDSNRLIEHAAAGAAKLYLVQLLDPWEIDPQPAGWTTVVDIESEDTIDLSLDPETINCYRKRLTGLQQACEQSGLAAGAHWVSVSAATELEPLSRNQLVRVGLLCERSAAEQA